MADQIRILDEGVDLGLITTLNFIGADIAIVSATGARKVGTVTVASAGSPLTLENRTSDPVAPATGRIWLRTDL